VAGANVSLWDRSTRALLRIVLVGPNLVVAIPWLAGFLFGSSINDRQALHDRVAPHAACNLRVSTRTRAGCRPHVTVAGGPTPTAPVTVTALSPPTSKTQW